MKTRTHPFIYVLIPIFLLFAATVVNRGQAQEGEQNPTPIVISLTPPGTPVGEPTATPDNGLAPDRFEPNDEAETATMIGFQSESGLTLLGDDVDAFSGFLKAGQILQVSTTVYDQLDTRLRLFWEGQMVAENDDRSPVDLGSAATFTAPADGRYVAFVTKSHGTLSDGVYDLQTALVAPTATPTLLPTLTPTALPTLTPLPTPTMMPSPTPLIQPDASGPHDGAGPPRPIVLPSATAAATITVTATLTASERLSLTVRHVGRVEPQSDAAETKVRLLVYYDANNDRAPGPNEGIPNVSMLAVDALGQRLAQVFTNAQGEATFNLRGRAAGAVARIIVPFVPAWSARVQAGAADNELVLGLPAVRLPVFFPRAPTEAGERG